MLYIIFVVPVNLIIPAILRFIIIRKYTSKILAVVITLINLIAVMILLFLVSDNFGLEDYQNAIIIGCGIAIPLVYLMLTEKELKWR